MLYNESTGKPKVQADVFSLESLIAWLEKQPADENYDYHDCGGSCLISQYLTAHGKHWSQDYGKLGYGKQRSYIAGSSPMTFGAALSRARKALAS